MSAKGKNSRAKRHVKQKKFKQRSAQDISNAAARAEEPATTQEEEAVPIAASAVTAKPSPKEDIIQEKSAGAHKRIFSDLRFIGVSAAVIFILLIILSFVL